MTNKNEGLIVTTTFALKSGQGTPMFSRSGKETCAEYMVFKEPHERVEKLKAIPEEVLQETLKNDLKGEEKDVYGAYITD